MGSKDERPFNPFGSGCVLGPDDPRAITNVPRGPLTRRERDLFRMMRDRDLFDLDERIDRDAFFASLDD